MTEGTHRRPVGWAGSKSAVAAARKLIAQGIEGVTIMNEDGCVYLPKEFISFLDEENRRLISAAMRVLSFFVRQNLGALFTRS